MIITNSIGAGATVGSFGSSGPKVGEDSGPPVVGVVSGVGDPNGMLDATAKGNLW